MNNQYPPDAQPDYYKKFDFGWSEYPPGVTYEDAMKEGVKSTSELPTTEDEIRNK